MQQAMLQPLAQPQQALLPGSVSSRLDSRCKAEAVPC